MEKWLIVPSNSCSVHNRPPETMHLSQAKVC